MPTPVPPDHVERATEGVNVCELDVSGYSAESSEIDKLPSNVRGE